MMIGYIKGRITAIFPECCFLETAGIGYRIFVSAKDREKLQNGQDVKLLTYMAVREAVSYTHLTLPTNREV